MDSFAAINIPNPKGDAVYFHTDSWYENLDILDKADRIILCNSNDDNIAILSKIKSLCPMSNSMAQEKLTKEIYIRTDTELLVSTLFVLGDDRYRIIPSVQPKKYVLLNTLLMKICLTELNEFTKYILNSKKEKGVTKLKNGSRFQSSNDTPMCPRRILL